MIYRNAKRRDIQWDISYTDAMALLVKSCVYCGLEATDGTFNGIDRLDSSLGYSSENCVPCCSDCNFAKNAKSPEQFRAYVVRVSTWMARSGSDGLGRLP